MWWWHDGVGMWWGMLFGGLVPLLLFVLLGYALLRLLADGRASGGSSQLPPAGPAATRDSALEVAERRYAAGEISREEFLRIREDLTSRGNPPAG